MELSRSKVSYVKSPCKNCPDKGCGAYHCECGRYMAFVEAREKIRKIRNSILHVYDPSPLLERNIRKKLNRTKHK